MMPFATVVLVWLWRRQAGQNLPRRLVWCLPNGAAPAPLKRRARLWLERLGLDVNVCSHLEVEPLRETLVVATQSELLSAALNRSYGASCYAWPRIFGLLHNDSLWVFSGAQLQRAGRLTSLQLEGLRRRWGTSRPCHSLWLTGSAQPGPWQSADFALSQPECQNGPLPVWAPLVKEVELLAQHRPQTHTLAVFNTRKKARAACAALRRKKAPVCLVHRFWREADGERFYGRLAEQPGQILIGSSGCEAALEELQVGPVLSEITDLALMGERFQLGQGPYFGWTSAQTDKAESPSSYPTLRSRDLLDLFHTRAEVAGAETDLSAFFEEPEEAEVLVFWREFSVDPHRQAAPRSDEFCPVPLGELQDFLRSGRSAWRHDWLQNVWVQVDPEQLLPGQLLLLEAQAGGYRQEAGWDPDSLEPVPLSCQPACLPVPGRLADYSVLLDPGERAAFQEALARPVPLAEELPARPHLRPELASALLALSQGQSDLSVYLSAARWGRVRTSLVPLPGESPAPEGRPYSGGLWHGDICSQTPLDLTFALLGEGPGGASWQARMSDLLARVGPFRLAYLEALMQCAGGP